MAKILRDLLDAEEPVFSLSLRQLEQASGQKGVDVKLIAEIAQKMHSKTAELGLDPDDTSPRELYRALLAKIENDNERVTAIVGGTDSDNVRHIVPLIVAAVEKMDINRKVWVLKHSVAKRLLQKMPPQKLMKHLGYKSIDSMLKHEDIDEVYTALRFSEGGEWLNAYNELFKTVKPSDFETRDIRIIIMDHDKYVDLAEKFVLKKLHNITHTKEMGTIVVVPMHQERMKGLTLKSLPLIFHYINEIRLYSAFFKLKQVNANFGETLVETLIADPGNASQMAGQNVHWRVIQRYFGKLHDEAHPEAFEPHVHPEDLHWRKAEEMLAQLDPQMAFWQDLDYVGQMFDGQPITFNLMDVSLAYSNGNGYQDRLYYHFRESLWNEIFMRYMGEKNLEDQILGQLDNDLIAPETLRVNGRPALRKTAILEHSSQKPEALIAANKKRNLLVRKRLIDAAEGEFIGVVDEFDNAFRVLEMFEKTVTIFGSARLAQDSPTCQTAYQFGHMLAQEGYAVVTGGGGGVMEAANHGALDAKGASIGFNIELPTEQHLNPYTTNSYQFKHFFGRKVALTLDADAYVFFAGGFGTFDELFEITTLIQTGVIPVAPMILIGTEYWNPVEKVITETLRDAFETISQDDPELHIITDDLDEAMKIVKQRQVRESQKEKSRAKGK